MEKIFFRPKMPEICWKTISFGIFSRFYHFFFMAESNFGEKIFLAENGVNMPEIAVFAEFVRVFSSCFVIFSHKNIINNNTHHQACFNCLKNWFLMPELSKNRRNSQFSPEKRYFLILSSCIYCTTSILCTTVLLYYCTTYFSTTCFLFCSFFDYHLVGPLCILLVLVRTVFC